MYEKKIYYIITNIPFLTVSSLKYSNIVFIYIQKYQ